MNIFKDKDGNTSGKRVAGVVILAAAVVFTFFGKGEIDLVNTMFYTGALMLGVTAFERKS